MHLFMHFFQKKKDPRRRRSVSQCQKYRISPRARQLGEHPVDGILGVGVTLLLLIPANAIIHTYAEQYDINAALPPLAAFVLILLSVVLTLIGGIIPSRKAAHSDPVAALRSE